MRVKELFQITEFEIVWNYINDIYGPKNSNLKIGLEQVYQNVISSDSDDDSMLVCLYEEELDDETFMNVSGIRLSDIHKNMSDKEFSFLEYYALELCTFSEWSNWKISDYSLEKYGKIICAGEILWEMTFFSTDEDVIKKEKEKLIKISEDIEKEVKEAYSIEEVTKELTENISENYLDEVPDEINNRFDRKEILKQIIKVENL